MGDRADVEEQFEAWAQVAAKLRHRPREEKLAILQDLGLSERYWRDVNEAWAKSLNSDIATGELDRPHRYARICKAELAARANPEPRSRDFRDSLTPPGHPQVPMSRQPETVPGVDVATKGIGPGPSARLSGGAAPAPDDFRRELVPVERPLEVPSPHQIETVEGGEGSEDLIEAARQANTAALWPIEKWARLCAELERRPHDADQLWAGVGVTNPRARPHIRNHYKRKLAGDPASLERFNAVIAERLGPKG